MSSAGAPPQYISFCEKKVKRPDGTYTLFWIQDTANRDTLAIVGKGAKYRTPPRCKSFPAYSASSKNEVLGWLASIGAERQITDKAAKVPQLTENDWLDLQPKSRKAAVKQVASKPKHPPGKPTHPSSTPQAQQKQHQQQLQHSQRSSQHAKSNAMRATPSNTNPMSKDPAPLDSSKKAAGRPKKRARTREACEYCDKSTHDSEDCPVKLAAEEGSEAEISEDDQSCDQLNEPAHGHTHGGAHGGPHDHMGTDAAEPAPDSAQEESDSEDEEADQEPSVAPEPLRHETVVRREPGREVSFSPEVQDAYKHDPELLNWVSGSWDQDVLNLLTQWSTELTGIVSPSPPKQMFLDNEGQPLRWLETSKAVHILRQLQSQQINLRMLELSQISMPVAMLRNNADQDVQMMARALAKKWRELAVKALDCATDALKSRR